MGAVLEVPWLGIWSFFSLPVPLINQKDYYAREYILSVFENIN
jgi:hypothetical protein